MEKSENDQIISELCKRSIEKIWHEGSRARILKFCPFCLHALDAFGHPQDCSVCICPSEICAESTQSGFISHLIKEYEEKGDDIRVCDISRKDLEIMISLYKAYIIE